MYGRDGTRHEPDAVQVHVEHPLEVLEALVGHVPVAVERGVVHEDVDAPEAVDGGARARGGGVGVGDVAVDELHRAELRELEHGRGGARVVDVGDHDGRALPQEALGVGPADAAAPAGDDGDTVLEAHGALS